MEAVISGIPILDWGLVALSSFNTVLPIWLGLTILLSAERRSGGVWLAGLGMLATGAFFIFHTAMLEGAFFLLPDRLRSWWYVGWLPVIALPYGWYIAMLWFGGYWDRPGGALHRRHRLLLPAVGLLGLVVVALLFAAERPYPHAAEGRSGSSLSEIIFFLNSPLPIILYAIFIILCLVFSLDPLRRLEPSSRAISDIARMRARPWLAAASSIQIGISILVIWGMLWMTERTGEVLQLRDMLLALTWLDIIVSSLIALSLYLLGRAIVSYEIFTGKVLPRQGLRRHWRNAIIIAAGYSVAMSVALGLGIPSFYILLGTTIVVAAFYALLNWRSYIERDRFLEHLRPFVGSQQLYARMVEALDSPDRDGDIATPFHTLCADILGARLAYLVPLGPLGPLAGPPLSYPRGTSNALPWLAGLMPELDAPGCLSVQLVPARSGGALWGIPLWSERGLIGVLLLGEKLDGGLYTQEELEIARASGERLIDMQAATEMARRLIRLQRQRMVESQVLDARTRRVLHDDILPQIHAALLALRGEMESKENRGDIVALMTGLHKEISDLLRAMPTPAAPNLERLGIIGALRQVIEGELKEMFDEVQWEVEPAAEALSTKLTSLSSEVLYYAAREAIRNAARYGRRAGATEPLRLTVALTRRNGIVLAIEDNGNGFDPTRPSDGGSGQGLALHGTMMAVVGGSLSIESIPEEMTRVVLVVPEENVGS